MVGCVTGKNKSEVQQKVFQRTNGRLTQSEMSEKGWLVGTLPEIYQQIQVMVEAGAQRVILQWLELDDLETLEELAHIVLARE